MAAMNLQFAMNKVIHPYYSLYFLNRNIEYETPSFG